MKTQFISIFICTALSLYLASCQKDKYNGASDSKTSNTSMEEAYFDDYEADKHKWGYMNKNGRIILSADYDDCRDFKWGLAAVNSEGKWGFINTTGQFEIDPQFRSVWHKTPDRIIALDFSEKYKVLDQKGKTLYTSDIPILDADQKYILVYDALQHGIRELDGTEVIPTVYNELTLFRNSLAVAKRNFFYGIIDQARDTIIDFSYDMISGPAEGHYRLLKEGKWRHFSTEDDLQLNKGCRQLSDYYGGVCAALTESGWELRNTESQVIRKVDKGSLRYGGEGIWYWQTADGVKLMDSDGQDIETPMIEIIYPFKEGRAAYMYNDAWGYIDTSGKVIVAAQYPLVWSYKNGLARVIDRDGLKYIDIDGNTHLKTKYFEARDFHNGLARVQLR